MKKHDLSVIGSFNMDMRSTYLDTELMLVIRSKDINKQLEEMTTVGKVIDYLKSIHIEA